MNNKSAECYQVTSAVDEPWPAINLVIEEAAGARRKLKLALILSFSQPQRKPVVGLLVAVYEKQEVKGTIAYYSRIIFRIKISRIDSAPLRGPMYNIFGERTKDGQSRCVDDFHADLEQQDQFEGEGGGGGGGGVGFVAERGDTLDHFIQTVGDLRLL